jgi:transcriptional regulator with XRE-family HTH domain
MATLKELRERAGLTAGQLALKAGVSYQTVRRLERGERVSRVYLLRVLNALGAREDDIEERGSIHGDS